MLARNHRFHGYGSLRFVYQKGQTVRTTQCALKFVDNPRRQTYRAAVVVSKKVAKSAVKRNRIRRRVFEILRQNLPVACRQDLVVSIFSEQLAEQNGTELNQQIVGLLKSAGLFD